MLSITLFIIAIVFVVGFLVLFLVLDFTYFRKKLTLFQRVSFYTVISFIFLVSLFSLIALFTQEVQLNFGFVLLSLIISLVFGIGTYTSMKFSDSRIERLREQCSKLPDGPEKQQKLKLLEHLENMRNK
ncbi:MAG: hypothetical protein GY797_30665 [Deltaproteobacteria bacterium]|nr:hypothetical protein [Deltaproteobacteria bacterium]